jgi:phage tail tape-measure protein
MTMSRRLTAAFAAVTFAAAISGCATSSNPQPSVYAYPAKGQTPEQQARDSSECQMWAKQQSGWDPTTDTAKGVGIGAAVGALGGAALGAAVGAAAGSPGTGAAIGAAAGGVGGATYGGTSQYGKGKAGYDSAYAACMNGRGYTTK